MTTRRTHGNPGDILVYTPLYRRFSFGPEHPLRPLRLHLAYTLMGDLGLLEGEGRRVVEPGDVTDEEILRVHTSDYLRALKEADKGVLPPGAREFGLGTPDNPVFPGIYQWGRLSCEGTLTAVRAVAEGTADRAFHPGGGHHHAHAGMASGFCYLNDINVALADQLRSGRRILYLDIDAHHADGVAEFFYRSDRVLVVSFHEQGETLFPGTGRVEETGEGPGAGFTVNLPLLPGSSDAVWREAFDAVVIPLFASFSPHLLILQTGVDAMSHDPLAHLEMTTGGLSYILKGLLSLSPRRFAALGGGGYELDTVARCWALAWGILCGTEPRDRLPDTYLAERSRYGATGADQRTLRDPAPAHPPDQGPHREHLHRLLAYLRSHRVIP